MPASIEDLLASIGATVLGVGGAAFAYQFPRALGHGRKSRRGSRRWLAGLGGLVPAAAAVRTCRGSIPIHWVRDHTGRPLLYVAVVEALQPTESARELLRPDKSLKKRPLDFAARVESDRSRRRRHARGRGRRLPRGRLGHAPRQLARTPGRNDRPQRSSGPRLAVAHAAFLHATFRGRT